MAAEGAPEGYSPLRRDQFLHVQELIAKKMNELFSFHFERRMAIRDLLTLVRKFRETLR